MAGPRSIALLACRWPGSRHAKPFLNFMIKVFQCYGCARVHLPALTPPSAAITDG